MYGIFRALYLLSAEIADHFTTKWRGRKSAAKLQKHFDEYERIRRKSDARIQKSINRMMKEDAERQNGGHE